MHHGGFYDPKYTHTSARSNHYADSATASVSASPAGCASSAAQSQWGTLPQRMNVSTRKIHASLNAQILRCLPLALPPHSLSFKLYAHGFLHFACLYVVLEQVCCALEDRGNHAEEDIRHELRSVGGDDLNSISDWKALLPPPRRIRRTDRIRADLRALHGDTRSHAPTSSCPRRPSSSRHEVDPSTRTFALQSSVLEPSQYSYFPSSSTSTSKPEQASITTLLQSTISVSPTLSNFQTHLHDLERSRPHRLFAYQWVLYMALFNGGRFIRAQLKAARDSFWDFNQDSPDTQDATTDSITGSSRVKAEENGLSFWYFERLHQFDADESLGKEERGMPPTAMGPDDEDVKSEFKERFSQAESFLDEKQRAEIVEEAHRVYEWCALLVEELREWAAAQSEAASIPQEKRDGDLSMSEMDSLYPEAVDAAEHSNLQILFSEFFPESLSLLLKHVFPLGLAELGHVFLSRLPWSVGDSRIVKVWGAYCGNHDAANDVMSTQGEKL
ncbi:heme oxygenase [Agyrium rufum]|nr:heme oxygenase [Agyrium rufum]